MNIPGRFSDGNTSKLIDARLEILGGDVMIVTVVDSALLIRQSVADVKVSSRLGNTPRTITFKDGESFETDDNDGVDSALTNWQNPANNLLHKLENNTLLILFAVAFTMCVITWTVVVLVPNGANSLAHALPEEVVQEMGAASLEILDRTMFDASTLDEQRQEAVRQLLMAHLPEEKITLHFRAASPNAFALPDQSIVFTDGLIELAEHDDELIAIAFHELGHVEHRHLVRRSIQGSAIAVLLFLLTGDVGSIDVLVTLPAALVDLAYSREFELEADTYALKKMVDAGINPVHFRNIMQRLDTWYREEDEKATDSSKGLIKYLSTHPQTSDRLELMDSYQLQFQDRGVN